MGFNLDKFLLHAGVGWLQRRRELSRPDELKEEMKLFTTKKKPPSADSFQSKNWLCNLSYLEHVFEKLCGLNIPLQGEISNNILILHDKITGLVTKISISKQKVVNGN
jgi:hypothetical protein